MYLPNLPMFNHLNLRRLSSAGAYSPRWDVCTFVQIDSDHFDLSLPLEDGGYAYIAIEMAASLSLP